MLLVLSVLCFQPPVTILYFCWKCHCIALKLFVKLRRIGHRMKCCMVLWRIVPYSFVTIWIVLYNIVLYCEVHRCIVVPFLIFPFLSAPTLFHPSFSTSFSTSSLTLPPFSLSLSAPPLFSTFPSPKGSDPVPGESESEYVARQRKLQEEVEKEEVQYVCLLLLCSYCFICCFFLVEAMLWCIVCRKCWDLSNFL